MVLHRHDKNKRSCNFSLVYAKFLKIEEYNLSVVFLALIHMLGKIYILNAMIIVSFYIKTTL